MGAARVRSRGRAAWGWMFTGLAAAALAANARAADDEALAGECLLPRGGLQDTALPLRLAMPPVDPQNPGGAMQAVMSRLMSSPSSAGGAAPARVAEALSRFGPPAAPLSATTRLLIDGGAGVLAGRHAEYARPLADCEQQALKQGDAFTASACANNLAVAQAAQGQAERARVSFERALRHLEAPRQPPADPKLPPQAQAMVDASMSRLGGVMAMMTPEQRAQFEARLREQQASMGPQMREAALAVWRRFDGLNARRAAERTTLNLGQLALATGRLADAQAWLQRAYDAPAGDDPPACKAASALDLARLAQRLGRSDESRALLARHRTAAVADSGTTAFEMGAIRLAMAAAAAPVAAAGAAPVAAATPASFFDESSSRFSESALARLLDEATRAPTSDTAWQRLALRAAAARRADLGFAAQAALMRLAAARGDGAAAIAHGKQAVNLSQGLRAGLADGTPSREARRAFLRERRQVYVALAQALLDQQRLVEAEAVLQLLKEDEGQQFIGGDAPARPAGLPLMPHEQAWQQQQDRVATHLREAEQQRAQAAAAMPLGGGALLLAGADQIEAGRLKAGLALAGLPAQLARKPPQRLSRDAAGQAAVRDVRDFFLGPQARLERFLSHLIEDAPQFNPPADPREMARLADTLARVRDLQAALAPLLREAAWVDPPAGPTLTVRPAGSKADDDELVLLGYTMAEPLERLWRTGREADQLESRHLQSAAGRPTAPPPEAAAGAALPDDTRALLAQQPLPTALLYYLPGDDRLDVLFVGPRQRRHWRLAVPRRELDAQVQAFAEALRRSDRDPRPAAQALYQRLFAPVAATVAESGAQVLALSLADRLRFVPFAALHDGQGWLVERHALALHPGGTLTGRLKPASARWQVAAFGASAGDGEFPPLPSVRGEIASVVRQGDASQGALPGQAWLDQAFTAERLRSALGSGAQVLHIASHFKFVGGDAQASYLLLGDGGRLSLRELASPGYRFDRTELVTLSACATGLSADDTWGQEVDGLAALLMGQGAPAVLASLWEVNDRSTAALMGTLYRQREGRQLSRALALQQAQLTMIRGASSASSTTADAAAGARGASRIRLPGDPEPDPADAAFAPPAALGHGHPFHWAAFVLMGNWR